MIEANNVTIAKHLMTYSPPSRVHAVKIMKPHELKPIPNFKLKIWRNLTGQVAKSMLIANQTSGVLQINGRTACIIGSYC